jgi:hypothetical protein
MLEGPGAMLIYRVAGTSPQDGDYFARSGGFAVGITDV